ncbi:MAG: hypothetical protein Tsb0010_01800 [Parvularculaceae bacterium]
METHSAHESRRLASMSRRGRAAVLATALACAASAAPAHAQTPPYDLEKLERGEMRFDLMLDGEVRGEWFVSKRIEDGAFTLIDATTLYPDIRETVAFVVDAVTLAPRRAVLDADFSRRILDADLTGAAGAIRGEYRTKGPDEVDKRIIPFELALDADVTFRGVVFHLAPTLPLEEGARYEARWFNTLNGQIEDISISVGGTETVETPAGVFEARRMTFEGGSVGNVIYVAEGDAPKIVRVDVLGQNMTFLRRRD